MVVAEFLRSLDKAHKLGGRAGMIAWFRPRLMWI
jgi:hypothetical protein